MRWREFARLTAVQSVKRRLIRAAKSVGRLPTTLWNHDLGSPEDRADLADGRHVRCLAAADGDLLAAAGHDVSLGIREREWTHRHRPAVRIDDLVSAPIGQPEVGAASLDGVCTESAGQRVTLLGCRRRLDGREAE